MVYLGNRDQSKTNTHTQNKQTNKNQHTILRKKVTNQTSPYLEILFFHEHSLYKQCNPKPGAPPYSRCVSNNGSPSSSLVIKTLLLSHGIGSLVVIGRFLDLGITPAYRFLRRQVRWSGIPISLRILHSLCDPHKVFSIINETEVDVLGRIPLLFLLFLKLSLFWLSWVLVLAYLSCVMRDLVPLPGIEPRPPALGAKSLSHWTIGEVPLLLF